MSHPHPHCDRTNSVYFCMVMMYLKSRKRREQFMARRLRGAVI